MALRIPTVVIQSDWNEAVKLPKTQVWIYAKYLNEPSTHGQITTSINPADNKLVINITGEYQYVAHSNMSLVVKHTQSGVKVAFVAPTKAHSVHSKGVLSVSVAENALAVSSCEDRFLVWDSRTSEVLLTLEGHGGPVYKCRFFPSGTVLISAGADGSCRIWSAESGVSPVTLKGHSMGVADISIVDKGRNVISVSRDGSAKLWDVGESNCLADLLQGNGPINCCCIATSSEEFKVDNEREVGTENKLLVVACESGVIICTRVAKREELFRKTLESPCNSCCTLDSTVVIGCSDGKIIQLSLPDGEIINEWHESASPVLSLLGLQTKTFVVGRQDGTCTMISTQDQHKAVRVQLTGSDCDGIRDLSFNGKWIFAACRDTYVRKYDINQLFVHFK